MGFVLGVLSFVAVTVLLAWRSRGAAGPAPDPDWARALKDALHERRERKGRGLAPSDGRQMAGEDCAECQRTIVAEIDGTACGLCDALLHLDACAKRHICASAERKAEQPYRG